METQGKGRETPRTRRAATAALAALLVIGLALYAANSTDNPPGFYIDESSIAYNAHLIATTGRDEHGESFPLHFRAFGDYKNPVYVYALAALFRATGPSIAAARLFSASLGALAALALGLLALRMTERAGVAAFVAASALLTPWLFELSRVVVEVAAYPLAVALFLLCARRASERERWPPALAASLAASLALVTYVYSIGRLLGPLLAAGLALMVTRARVRGLLTTWVLYALSLVPALVFTLRRPGALTDRFKLVTFVTPQSSFAEDAWEFARHYFYNLSPWRMLVAGDPSPQQIASIYGVGLVLAATFALAACGAVVAIKRARREAWWRLVLYGLAASVVPASLTKEYFHMLRLAAVPVFLLVLTVPAVAWLLKRGRARRALLAAAVALTVAQGAWFQTQYHASARSPRRLHLFDADYPAKIFPAALEAAGDARPIHLADAPSVPGYIQAFWYARLRGVPHERLVLLKPDVGAPEGAVVITTDNTCPRCRKLAESEPYTAYVAEGPPRIHAPLPASGFRAAVRAESAPARLRVKERATLRVVVRNEGDAVWLVRERGGSPYQLSLGNHWLDTQGRVVTNDDGRASLMTDVPPGGEVTFDLVVNAPRSAGDYLLEIDMLQEGVSWFGLRGSKTLRIPVKVE